MRGSWRSPWRGPGLGDRRGSEEFRFGGDGARMGVETANFQTLLPGLSSHGSAGPGVSLEERSGY